ncbi:hypothetical protein BH23GEM6_BH23GEM6_27480 [soil metagenome]
MGTICEFELGDTQLQTPVQHIRAVRQRRRLEWTGFHNLLRKIVRLKERALHPGEQKATRVSVEELLQLGGDGTAPGIGVLMIQRRQEQLHGSANRLQISR